jgi:hypothetical protein
LQRHHELLHFASLFLGLVQALPQSRLVSDIFTLSRPNRPK